MKYLRVSWKGELFGGRGLPNNGYVRPMLDFFLCFRESNIFSWEDASATAWWKMLCVSLTGTWILFIGRAKLIL